MSAFAVIYERSNIPVDPGMLERLMESQKHRGPDGKNVRFSGHIAMGHCHFWITPEEIGERQPLQLSGSPYQMVMDGRLDNRTDLLKELHIDPEIGDGLSDANLILRAYERWGVNCFRYLIGEFAIVIFDEQRNEIICARDALGDRTLYYSFTGNRVVIASESWAVANCNTSTVQLNEKAIAHYFALTNSDDGQSLFANVYELLPASVMAVSETTMREWKYWLPEMSHRLKGLSSDEYADVFRSLLEQSVRARIRSAAPVGVLMSGGLDSTSVASLAARMLAPKPLTTISFVYDEVAECDERQYINAAVEQFGVCSIQIPCDDAWPYKDLNSWPFDPNRPEGNPYRLVKERAYQEVNKNGIRVLLSGVFADALLSSGNYWLADLLVDGYWTEAVREFYRHLRHLGWDWMKTHGHIQPIKEKFFNIFPSSLFSHQKLHYPEWLTPYSNRYLMKDTSNGKRNSFLFSPYVSKGITAETFHASRHAIELSDPYRDRRLVEFVLSLPAYELYYRGYHKRVLRKAMKNILPEVVRTRRQNTYMLPFYFRGIEFEKENLQEYFQVSTAFWHQFVEKDWVSPKWDTRVSFEQDGPHILIPWLCISFETWYKKIANQK